ncbi:MAG: tetratricopeptide repeat protein [Leptospiraceae bacterium]|nr:tetratricopeptide repeat protein [Leptospiraceae bacterium]MDW8307558.1 tetratricopeptide repeat protein [Leptospiraceae bacterium]
MQPTTHSYTNFSPSFPLARKELLQKIRSKSENLPHLKDSVSLTEISSTAAVHESITDLRKEAQALQKRKHYREALQKLEDALLLSPGNLDILYEELFCLFPLKKYEACVKIAQHILREKNDKSYPHLTKFLLLSLCKLGNYDEAEKIALEILKENPFELQIMNILTFALERQKKFEEAEKWAYKILEKDENNASACNNLAYILVQQNKNLEEALKLVKKALQKEKSNPSYLDTLGLILAKRGNLAAARRVFRQALEKDPGNKEIEAHLKAVGAS